MPDKQGRTQVHFPPDLMEKVRATQRLIAEESGVEVKTGVAVRQLIELGFAQRTRNNGCLVSSGVQ